MNKGRNVSKAEWILLGLTGLFLCGLLILDVHDRNAREHLVVETVVEVPQETFMPEVSLVNLNTASVEELMELPGIGKELARRIVEYRVEHGDFETVQALMEVSGIGESKVAGLEDWVTVDGKDAQ